MKRTALFAAIGSCVVGLALQAATGAEGYRFQNVKGKHLDLLLDGKPVTRYMYEVDTSDKAKTFDTAKVYTHVFNAEGTDTITKGPGGLYPHHRGIFLGFRVTYDGKQRGDWWHVRNVTQRHQKFLQLKAAGDSATSTMLIHWNDRTGKCVLAEERTQIVYRQPEPALLLLDFIAKLTAVRSDIELGGDPEHAGMQYRPHNDVNRKATKYMFPDEKITSGNVRKEVDLPWAAECYELKGKKYTVQHMNHPENPKGTKYSAYRDYGRFGAFPTAKVKQSRSITLRYRVWVAPGEQLDRAAMQARYEAFAKAPKPNAAK
jgi:hypothetical protein